MRLKQNNEFFRSHLPAGFVPQQHLQSIWSARSFRYFQSHEGLVAYQETPQAVVVAGDPYCFNGNGQELLIDFYRWAKFRGKRVLGYYFSDAFRWHSNFRSYQLGLTRYLDLEDWSLSGKKGEPFRRAINFSDRVGYSFFEIDPTAVPAWCGFFDQQNKRWFRQRKVNIEFLLGHLQLSEASAGGRWFVICHNGECLAYVSIYSYRGGYYIDRMVRRPWGARMAMDALISHLTLALVAEGQKELHFGLCPFQNSSETDLVDAVLNFGGRQLPFFNSEGLYHFKKKFTNREEPQYLLLGQGQSFLADSLELARVTFAQRA